MRKLNIFSEVKEHVTARNVAEFYGLKVKRNGLACCPFHNDKHPSMKIDKFYYCFACGAKGDAINYVASTYGLSQYEAAKKIAEDFHIILQSEEKKDANEAGNVDELLSILKRINSLTKEEKYRISRNGVETAANFSDKKVAEDYIMSIRKFANI